MGMVSSLKFDEHAGAVLVNEEFMNPRHRRKLYLDPAQSLLSPDMAEAWDLEAVYAGCGKPGINQEVIDTVKSELQSRFDRETKNKKKAKPAPSLKDVALLCAKVLQKIIHRDMNLKLNLFYGFGIDDFNRSYFKNEGKKYEIKQEKVKKKANDILHGRYNDRQTGLYKETRAEVFGHDSKYGIAAYHLDISNGNVGFNMEAYEALGHGKYGLETSLARYLNNVTKPMLEQGVSHVYGIYELIRAALLAREAFHFTGGNFNIVYIDGSSKKHGERYREFVDQQSRLAMHIVMAYETEYISKADLLELLEEALFKGEQRKKVEEKLFSRSSDAQGLDLILRGYKVHEVKEMMSKRSSKKVRTATKRSNSKKRRKK